MSGNGFVNAALGAAGGFVIGGPAGALLGAGAGLLAGSLFSGPKIEGPRLSDLRIQTSTYGAAIPRTYGTIAFAGNIIWLEGGKLREVVKKNKSGGKGGSSTEPDKTYTYFATFHLALCEGPIQGIRRIWCSDKLIYDAGSDDLETIIASNQASRGWTLYRGTDNQMPEPRYEADVGVENATANRGLAYLAFRDWNLTDYGNTLEGAQFKVEAVKFATGGGVVISSESYGTPPTFKSNASATGVAYDSDGFSSAVFREEKTGVLHHVRQNGKVQFNYSIAGLSLRPGLVVANLRNEDFVFVNDSTSVTQVYVGNRAEVRYISEPLDAPGSVVADERGILISSRKVSGNRVDVIRKYSEDFKTVFVVPASEMGGFNLDWYGEDVLLARRTGASYQIRVYTKEGLLLSENFVDASGSVSSTGNEGNIYVDGNSLYVFQMTPSEIQIDIINLATSSLENSVVIPHISPYYISPSVPSVSKLGDNVFALSSRRTGAPLYNQVVFSPSSFSAQAVPLKEVISDEIELSALLAEDDIDVSRITSLVKGYQVSGGSIRSALEPLATAFQFDVIQSGYKIKFVPRGGSSLLSVPYEDLGATNSDTPDSVFSQSREMDTQLPAKTTVSYIDAEREYEVSEQSAARINTEAVNEEDVELALVLGADEGAGIAEMLQTRAWLERTNMSFTVPPTYLNLEPTDVITVDAKTAIHEIFIQEIDYTEDGRLEIKGVPNSSAIYVPNASGGQGGTADGTVGLSGPSIFLPIDIPLVDEVSQNALGFVGAMTGYTDGWPGATAFRSGDSGQTWTDIQGYSGKSSIGIAYGILGQSDGYLIDRRAISLSMISGEPESITLDQVLTGYNYAAYGDDGRWEIVRFQSAALQVDGSYIVSDFLRGDKGTEWATGLHESGDWFILLDDPDNAFISMATESIGLDRLYRGITQRASIESGEDVEFSYEGVNLKPLSPVNAEATRDGSGDLTATFIRRSRLGNTWWGNGVQAPVGETTEAYEIDVVDGSSVVRTIESVTPAFSYSAADQVTDFGSAQSSILFRIYQLSSTIGRGYVREVTL
tara:strand:- start:17102 stop:20275 length:3174 start_codon:yes stop_codon:yes gene_type:complete